MACAILFLVGCEDLNTYDPGENNDSNSTENNCTSMSPSDCSAYCDAIDWSDLNNTDTTCLSYCGCKLPEPEIDCKKSDYEYCKIIITDDNNNTEYMCSDKSDYSPSCTFSSCECTGIDDQNRTVGDRGTNCTCPGGSSFSSSLISATGVVGGSGGYTDGDNTESNDDSNTSHKTYISHTGIRAKLFWIGEPGGDNRSAWDADWKNHYGGADTPNDRNNYEPATFHPEENPFYVALPYNDLGADGERKYGADNYIPWASEDDDPFLSICKNRWVKITANDHTAYAQWEDVGPYGDGDDINYVFGGKKPLNTGDTNGSGVTISPAVRDYLLGSGHTDTNATDLDWVFVEEADVKSGPWKDTITTRPSE